MALQVTRTPVASTVTPGDLIAARSCRKMLSVFNDSTSTLYLAVGSGGDSTDYTVKMVAQSYYEVPMPWNGTLSGAWLAANGFAYITEIY